MLEIDFTRQEVAESGLHRYPLDSTFTELQKKAANQIIKLAELGKSADPRVSDLSQVRVDTTKAIAYGDSVNREGKTWEGVAIEAPNKESLEMFLGILHEATSQYHENSTNAGRRVSLLDDRGEQAMIRFLYPKVQDPVGKAFGVRLVDIAEYAPKLPKPRK